MSYDEDRNDLIADLRRDCLEISKACLPAFQNMRSVFPEPEMLTLQPGIATFREPFIPILKLTHLELVDLRNGLAHQFVFFNGRDFGAFSRKFNNDDPDYFYEIYLDRKYDHLIMPIDFLERLTSLDQLLENPDFATHFSDLILDL